MDALTGLFRVFRYLTPDENEDCIYLVPVACNNQDSRKLCLNHYFGAGCGTVCNTHHGLTQRHAKQLSLSALHYLEFKGTRNRGVLEDSQDELGFVDKLLGEMGYQCPNKEHYHRNPN